MKAGGASARACRSIEQALQPLRGRLLAEQIVARIGVRVRVAHRDHRIEQGDEIRPGADGVERRPCPALLRVEHRRRRGGQVASRRSAEHADAVGPHTELCGPRSDDSDRAQHILQRRRVAVLDQPVPEDEDGDAGRRQPRDPRRLVGHGEPGVAAARTDDEGGAGRPGGWAA